MTASQDKVAQLESKLAFLEQDVSDLRDSVDAHQRQILALERHCEVLTDRLRQAIEDGDTGAGSTTDERPPHY